MARWEDIAAAEPEFAGAVQAFFDAGTHKTIATLRKDGSPRISGIEAQFEAGELWFGSMRDGIKARDLQRDGRFALHSMSPNDWKGDAKIAGRALEVERPGKHDAHWFKADIDEVVLVRLRDDRKALVIESWHEGRGLSSFER